MAKHHPLLPLKRSLPFIMLIALLISLFFFVRFLVSKKSPTNASATPTSTVSQPTTALVLPHHDLLLDQFPSYYATFSNADRQRMKHIILLSPNHFEPQLDVIKTRAGDFQISATETVPINNSLLSMINNIEGIVKDDDVFKNEHGVFLHLPFIAQYFPKADVTPLLLTRGVPQPLLDNLASVLQNRLNDGQTLLLVSTDFSHYLPYAQAEKNDARTLELIQKNKPDELLKLNDDYSDCPSCLYLLLRTLEKEYHPPQILFHGSSIQFTHLSPDSPTTSYFVLKW